MSVSIVIPCLNEEGSLKECIDNARKAFAAEPELEIIVADNGSTDTSKQIALQTGARLLEERRRGYGSAILRGFKEAHGEYLVMGDADCTYDFFDAVQLVQKLKEGADFAIGNRIGGKVDKGAMPWLHQHLGTPILSWVLSRFFGCRVHDINCGLRAIRRSRLKDMKLRSPGMEFASEMVIHAQKAGLKFAEAPIRYYRRHSGQAKLRTFRDGWRHLRFILLCAPFALFILPAIALIALSAHFYASDRAGFQLIASLFSVVAIQVLIFGVFAKAYLWVADSFLLDRSIGVVLEKFRLEYGLIVALLFALAGILFAQQFDLLNLIRGSTLMALSVQLGFSSFFLSIVLSKKDSS